MIFVPLLLYLFFFNSVSKVAGLECYTCSASLGKDLKCENLSYSQGSIPYNTCFYNDAVCAKYVVEYGDGIMIYRGCSHHDICPVLASRYNSYYNNLLDCQICNSNYCNTSNGMKFIPALIILLTLLCKLLR